MPTIRFTPNLQHHIECPETVIEGETVQAVLDAYFAINERARSYVLDDQGALRHHMMLFVDGETISDRHGLSDKIGSGGELYVVQALSGG